MDVGEAIKRPFSDLQKFVIGALLNILPIINFFSYGYALEAAGMSLKKDRNLPEWQDWGGLWVKGLLGVIIALIYSIPVIIVFFALGGATVFRTAFTGELDPVAIATLGTTAFVTALVGIVVWYILASALLNFVSKGSFGAAFEFGVVFKKAFTGGYLVAWIVSAVIYLVLAFIASIIPLLNFILVPAATFASLIIMFTLIGEEYKDL